MEENNSLQPALVPLIDHAFFSKLQEDRGFRQAVILDTETALAPFRISDRARYQLEATLELLNSIVGTLADHWSKDPELKVLLRDKLPRRVLLFAPNETAPFFNLTQATRQELFPLSEMANAIAETVFSQYLADGIVHHGTDK